MFKINSVAHHVTNFTLQILIAWPNHADCVAAPHLISVDNPNQRIFISLVRLYEISNSKLNGRRASNKHFVMDF